MTQGVHIATEHNVRRDIALRLTVVARMLRQNFDRHLSGGSMTRSQWACIAVVARKPGASQREVADALEMSEASAGRLIDRLCADGMLERQERADDRRARSVNLTAKAEPLLMEMSDYAKMGEARVFKGLDDEAIAQMKAALDVIYANLNR